MRPPPITPILVISMVTVPLSSSVTD